MTQLWHTRLIKSRSDISYASQRDKPIRCTGVLPRNASYSCWWEAAISELVMKRHYIPKLHFDGGIRLSA